MLVRPEGRTLPTSQGATDCGKFTVSMLVRPEGRTLPARKKNGGADPLVSMLVRPEGRTLLSCGEHLHRQLSHVSMLVRPEGRTLLWQVYLIDIAL